MTHSVTGKLRRAYFLLGLVSTLAGNAQLFAGIGSKTLCNLLADRFYGLPSDGGFIPLVQQSHSIMEHHFSAVDAYRVRFEEKIESMEKDPSISDFQRRGDKSKLTEAIGERGAAEFMRDQAPEYLMVQGFSAGHGFDQIYIKLGSRNTIQEILIVEAKGPNAILKTDAAKGPQMSKKWIRNTAAEMLKQDAVSQLLGKLILESLDIPGGPPKVNGKVIRANEKGGAEELACPARCRYN